MDIEKLLMLIQVAKELDLELEGNKIFYYSEPGQPVKFNVPSALATVIKSVQS